MKGKLFKGSFLALWMACLATGSTSYAEVSALDSAGLKEVATFSESASERVFQIDLQPLARCSFGDYDVILNDLQHAQGKLGLQLTMEQLSGDTKRVFYGEPREKKTADSNVGTYEVTIPSADLSGMYGIFLCSVTEEEAGRVPCSQQPLLSFDAMFGPYKVDSSGLNGGAASSKPFQAPSNASAKLYFAQFVAVNGRSLAIFLDSPSTNSTEQLAGFGVAREQVSALVDKAKPFSDTLGSLPLTADDQRLQMVVPYFSNKKCNGE